ncbi:iron-containing redox enzyme family protein [Hwanghaeella grinnelliae]|uniref:Iron-containing redox enzyme family protein n=1 Tax=Hwanghaeella grinnelliae TaxID=2500179 RepID=A0A3S3UL89_9PROT|nr:iron-containing redox enzyme family protein [Hwanghaeella grinnelliae]RVU33896.1 iron-containing redox enzyme family protein [Hwanghaeella grinnelliae]
MPQQSFYQRLLAETEADRLSFVSIPVIRDAMAGDVDLPLYLRYLSEAYHHVRFTCPLMGAALARCTADDRRYREALLEYLDEERGHEEWILEDIAALGGNAEQVRSDSGAAATRIMVGYAYYAVEHISPYALLGMVHVLEGMSVALADKAAKGIAQAILKAGQEDGDGSDAMAEGQPGKGFSYLMSHGSLDQDHVRFFETLVNGLPDEKAETAVIDTAKIMYRLFGDVFRTLGTIEENRHAA